MKPFKVRTLASILTKNPTICVKCREGLKPEVKTWKEGEVRCMSLFRYSEGFASLIYQFKGCGDYELRSVFLEHVLGFLKLRFKNHIIVPAPSYYTHDEARGFNHVISIYEQLGLPLVKAIEKTKDRKQTSFGPKGRKQVAKILRLQEKKQLAGKQVLFVDDVYTTGSTTRACIALLKRCNPKKIAVLVLAKVPYQR